MLGNGSDMLAVSSLRLETSWMAASRRPERAALMSASRACTQVFSKLRSWINFWKRPSSKASEVTIQISSRLLLNDASSRSFMTSAIAFSSLPVLAAWRSTLRACMMADSTAAAFVVSVLQT